LKEREADLRTELHALAATPAGGPDEPTVCCCVGRTEDAPGVGIFVYDDEGNTDAGGNDVMSSPLMTRQDHRALVESLFSDPMHARRHPGRRVRHPCRGGAARPQAVHL
jgi:hypothetical protein